MTVPNLATYRMEPLETHAAVLNAISEPDPTATPFYEMMSDALNWSNEKHPSLTSEIAVASAILIAVVAYRLCYDF